MKAVAAHYTVDDLEGAILEGLRRLGKDPDALQPADLAPVDEFHIRGHHSTAELAALVRPAPGARVVDVGSGLGGTARYLAHAHGCQVVGVDLTEAYCALAAGLSARVGLAERTAFHHGDALAMPFADAEFDIAWTEHAQMNIADKRGFYREIARVLTPGGVFAFHDIFAGEGEPHFPVPWAGEASISALAAPEEVRELLASLGFEERAWQDRSPESIEWFRRGLTRVEAQGPPPLGIHLLMGADARSKLVNILRNLEEGRITVRMGVYALPRG